ncbi:MAG: Phenazine biosynthesis protein PhzF [Candidatus Ruthia sp. Asou_11_S2]|nr:Phenazine biosynthesis protein PhzF [Candidatus Ruthia sp. Asou_11_S2]
MALTIYQIDAFTNKLFEGNPAGAVSARLKNGYLMISCNQ